MGLDSWNHPSHQFKIKVAVISAKCFRSFFLYYYDYYFFRLKSDANRNLNKKKLFRKVTAVPSLGNTETFKRRGNIGNYELPKDVSVALPKFFNETS